MNRRVKHAVFGTLAGAATLVLATWMASPLFAKADKAVNEAPPIAVDVAAETSPSITPTKVIPWCEANRLRDASDGRLPSGETYLDHSLSGLQFWRPMCDEAIVTTDPRLVKLVLPEFVSKLAPMEVIGGVQTNPAIRNRIDNVEGWAEISRCVEDTCEITGHRRFVINNELGLRKLQRAEYVPDWGRVKEGLALLPRDVDYIYYPSIWARDKPGDEHAERYQAMLCEMLPSVTLVTFELTGPDCIGHEATAQRLEYVRAKFGKPTTPIVYVYEHAKYYWRSDQILDARDSCQSPVMYVYPGITEFPVCANELAIQSARRAESLAATMADRAAEAEGALRALRDKAAAAEATLIGACEVLRDLSDSATPEVPDISDEGK